MTDEELAARLRDLGMLSAVVAADRIEALTAERDRLRKYLEAVIDEYNGHMYGPTMHAIEAARSELDKENGT